MNNLLNENNVVGIALGKKHTGKTTLLRQLLPLNDKQHFVCDRGRRFYGVIHNDFGSLIENVRSDKTPMRGKVQVCRFDNASDYDYLFELVNIVKNCVLVIDEVQLFIKYGKMNERLYEILTVGRNDGVDILFATISPIGLDKMIFRQADFVVCFNIQDKNDLQYLASNSLIGERAYELPTLSVDKHEKIVFGNTGDFYIQSDRKQVEQAMEN